jgi:hypothetical protein
MFGFINSLLRDLLGKYGRMVLDFLLSNSFVLCAGIVLYGTVLIFARRNLEKMGKKAKAAEDGDALSHGDPAAVFAAKEAEYWEQLRQDSQFPFISLQSSLSLYRVTQENMNKLLVGHFLAQQHLERRRAKK